MTCRHWCHAQIYILLHSGVHYRLKIWGRYGLKKKEINTFAEYRCIILFKSDRKNIYNVTKDFYFK